jgi:hypothetical protein
MSIKIINNLEEIIYVGFDEEEKVPILNKEFLEVTKEAKEYQLRLSEIYEDFQDKIYRFIAPCILRIDTNLQVKMEKGGLLTTLTEEKKKKEKLKEENQNEINLKEMKKCKKIKYSFENLCKENYVILNNDISKYYQITNILKEEKSLELLLTVPFKNEENSISINPFNYKISKNANLNYKIIFYDNRILEKTINIDINTSISTIQDQIKDQIKKFTLSPDIRFIYKGEDISFNALNLDIFKQKSKNKSNSSENKITNDEKYPKNSDKEGLDKIESEKSSILEKISNCKNLCELGFNFEKEHFAVLVPDASLKVCNLYELGTSSYSYGLRDVEYLNLFVFGADISVENFLICGNSNGYKFQKIDFSIYESNFKKEDYENPNKDSLLERYDFSNLLKEEYWKSQNLIFEQKNIIAKRTQDDDVKNPIYNIYSSSHFVNTENIEFSKDKVYSFIWKFTENPDSDYIYYFQKFANKFQAKINDELDILVYTNNFSNYYLYGFEYKMK